MEKEEILRQVLIKLMKYELLNKFTEIVFDYKLKKNDYIYIQYKVANGNITMNIFDNIVTNRFNGYVFLNEDNDKYIKSEKKDNTSINFIYLKKCYSLYKENKNQNNLILFSVWLFNKENTLNDIFPEEIVKVFQEVENIANP